MLGRITEQIMQDEEPPAAEIKKKIRKRGSEFWGQSWYAVVPLLSHCRQKAAEDTAQKSEPTTTHLQLLFINMK